MSRFSEGISANQPHRLNIEDPRELPGHSLEDDFRELKRLQISARARVPGFYFPQLDGQKCKLSFNIKLDAV